MVEGLAWQGIETVPTELRPEEKWAKTVLARVLGVPVEQYDDGSKPGMHDLIFVRAGVTEAVEVTAAADPGAIELWNFLENGKMWTSKRLQGGWSVELVPVPHRKRRKNPMTELELLLAELETLRIPLVDRQHPPPRELAATAIALGIVYALQSPTDFAGSIYPLPSQEGPNLDIPPRLQPTSFPSWVSRFLKSPHNADVRLKLSGSGSARRHVFVIVPPFSTAPRSAVGLLLHDAQPTRLPPPDLPLEVTDVWVASTWAVGAGLRWSPNLGWERFCTEHPTRL